MRHTVKLSLANLGKMTKHVVHADSHLFNTKPNTYHNPNHNPDNKRYNCTYRL